MTQHPNIVLILTDDQGPWALGCCGTPELYTPNLDALARTGLRMDQFYCASPVCSPARASLMTGLMPSAHGVLDWLNAGSMQGDDGDNGEPIYYLNGLTGYTDHLAAHGYDCGLSGKWHLGDSLRPQMSFSTWYAHQFGGGPYHNAPMIEAGQPYLEPEYLTEAITRRAVDFVRRPREADTPFYLSVHYTAPHSPWVGQHPQRLLERYAGCDFPSMPRLPIRDEGVIVLEPETQAWRDSLMGYFASITAVDEGVGQIVSALRESGTLDNTLIIFTSDNGFQCGHHGIWGKGNGTWPFNCYEEAARVPMIFNHPSRIPGGRVSGALAGGCDLFPTLLDYAGIDYQCTPLQPGMSLVPLLTDQTRNLHDRLVVYDEYGPLRMLRTGAWKYARFLDGHGELLFDLDADPGETINLAGRVPSAQLAKYRAMLAEWFDAHSTPEYSQAAPQVTGGGQNKRATCANAWHTRYPTKAQRLQK